MMILLTIMDNFQKLTISAIVKLTIVKSMCWADLFSTYNYHGIRLMVENVVG